MLRQTNLYISQWVKLSVIAIQRDVNTLSVRQNSMSTIVRAKSFLSPCYIIVYLSTIFSPIHLFTSYSPFLCSKSSYSLLPVIEKKKTCHYLFRAGRQKHSKTTGRENKAVITDLDFKCYTILLVELLIYLQKQAKETMGEDCIAESHS